MEQLLPFVNNADFILLRLRVINKKRLTCGKSINNQINIRENRRL